MAMKRPAFTTTRLEEERAQDKGKTVPIWLNDRELSALSKDQETLDLGSTSATIKFLVEVGRNLIYSQLGEENVKYLVSRKRNRYAGKRGQPKL